MPPIRSLTSFFNARNLTEHSLRIPAELSLDVEGRVRIIPLIYSRLLPPTSSYLLYGYLFYSVFVLSLNKSNE